MKEERREVRVGLEGMYSEKSKRFRGGYEVGRRRKEDKEDKD